MCLGVSETVEQTVEDVQATDSDLEPMPEGEGPDFGDSDDGSFYTIEHPPYTGRYLNRIQLITTPRYV